MAYVFFPSCKAKADYRESSEKAAAYMERRFGIKPVGCCRINYDKPGSGDTAVVVCNNCAEIIRENSEAAVKSIWEIIDEDEDFVFPDHQGELITVQDCFLSFENRKVQDAVRSLLVKMNFKTEELEENYEKTKFCGPNLLSPCTPSNAMLAHAFYVERFPWIFTPVPKEEQPEYFRKHCLKIHTERAVCYCKFCRDGLSLGGTEAVHMLELLFP